MKFSLRDREAVYRVIFSRRDIRQFRPDPVPETTLKRILEAAHHAGSVGFMQPWNFILIRDPKIRERIRNHVQEENREAAKNYRGKRQALYRRLKLEGIVDSALNLCVTCHRSRGGSHVLGRNTIRETDLFSTCCAIQNLWLAARAEGVGVGWVSILENKVLKKILKIPAHVVPVAYLCIGYTDHFPERPMLETVGWRSRLGLEGLIFHDQWGQKNGG